MKHTWESQPKQRQEYRQEECLLTSYHRAVGMWRRRPRDQQINQTRGWPTVASWIAHWCWRMIEKWCHREPLRRWHEWEGTWPPKEWHKGQPEHQLSRCNRRWEIPPYQRHMAGAQCDLDHNRATSRFGRQKLRNKRERWRRGRERWTSGLI